MLERGIELRNAGDGSTKATVLQPERGLRLPSFYAMNQQHYLTLLDTIAEVNQIDAWLEEKGLSTGHGAGPRPLACSWCSSGLVGGSSTGVAHDTCESDDEYDEDDDDDLIDNDLGDDDHE